MKNIILENKNKTCLLGLLQLFPIEYEEMSPCRSSKSSSGNNFSEDALTEMAETRRLSSESARVGESCSEAPDPALVRGARVGHSCNEAPDPALVRSTSPASALRERVALFSAQRQASDSFLLRNQHHHQPDCVRWAACHEAFHCDNAAQDIHKVSDA